MICTKGLKNCRVVPSVFYSLMERISLIGRLLELDGTVYIYIQFTLMFYRGRKNPGPGGFSVLLRPSQLVRDRIGQNARAKPK